MKREFMILRHGKSDWRQPVDDFHRPLKKRGRKNAKLMGNWLSGQRLVPDYVISSSAVRALETARLACGAMQFPVENIRRETAMYGADEMELLQVVRAVPQEVRRVLLVGHNMGVEDFVLYLSAGAVDWPLDGKLMPTAALARFAVTGSWAEMDADTSRLLEILYPRQLEIT